MKISPPAHCFSLKLKVYEDLLLSLNTHTHTHAAVFVLWVQWYMILAYCVVGVFIIIVTALVVWYVCANRHEWCVTVKKRKVVKARVRREALTEVFQPPPYEQTIDIGKSSNTVKELIMLMKFTCCVLQP